VRLPPLREACPEYANRFLRQAQDERLAYRRAQGFGSFRC
jgi:hypothetical protein